MAIARIKETILLRIDFLPVSDKIHIKDGDNMKWIKRIPLITAILYGIINAMTTGGIPGFFGGLLIAIPFIIAELLTYWIIKTIVDDEIRKHKEEP